MTTKTDAQSLQSFHTTAHRLKPFAFNITEYYFASVLENKAAVQDVLISLESGESDFWQRFHSIHTNKLKDTERFLEDKKSAEMLKILIGQTERNLAEDTSPAVNAIHEGKLATLKSKLKRVQSRIDRRDSTKVFKNHVTSQISEVVARGLESLAVQLGEWFATGVLGPGTVVYRGRKFTAE